MSGFRRWLSWEIGSGAVIADVMILAGLAVLGWLAYLLAQS